MTQPSATIPAGSPEAKGTPIIQPNVTPPEQPKSIPNANIEVMNANTTANANRLFNANLTREEYEKNKEYYGQKAKELGDKVGIGVNDGWLWVKTRAALSNTVNLRDSIIVDVMMDIVTLHGRVSSYRQKIKAGQIAQRIEGVKSVINNLTISPQSP